MYAAPTLNMVDRYRQLLKCVDGVFGELSKKYNELEKYHTEYKAYAEKVNQKLDECVKAEKPDELV